MSSDWRQPTPPPPYAPVDPDSPQNPEHSVYLPLPPLPPAFQAVYVSVCVRVVGWLHAPASAPGGYPAHAWTHTPAAPAPPPAQEFEYSAYGDWPEDDRRAWYVRDMTSYQGDAGTEGHAEQHAWPAAQYAPRHEPPQIVVTEYDQTERERLMSNVGAILLRMRQPMPRETVIEVIPVVKSLIARTQTLYDSTSIEAHYALLVALHNTLVRLHEMLAHHQ